MAIEPTDESGIMSMSQGALRITVERQRQIEAEGWTPEHDDTHDKGEMLTAAECYMQAVGDPSDWEVIADDWPWGVEGFHPSDDPIRNLEKAGALIAAEIDRLYRRKLRGLGWAV